MRALISVYDKKGIEEFSSFLAQKGYELYSTGGTKRVIKKAGLQVSNVADMTGYPDMLGGRVKTLHPAVFGGILAREDQKEELSKHKLDFIDLVCVNLYPFEKKLAEGKKESELLENIDIGGVTLLRAAAKNYPRVIVLSSPEDYDIVMDAISGDGISSSLRRKLAAKAFARTLKYESAISGYFNRDSLSLNLPRVSELRYGENPHQKAGLYGNPPYKKIQGKKELSFNNYQDMDAAVKIASELKGPAAAVIKHTVPCGAAEGTSIKEAYEKAYSADPMSAFGGIAAFNAEVDEDTAEMMLDNFYEVAAAPSFSRGALKILSRKENLRVVIFSPGKDSKNYRQIAGSFLVQDEDSFKDEKWDVKTSFKPDLNQERDLKFAWKVARFMKSNAVVIAGDCKTLGLGGGETARVTAVDIAVNKMNTFSPDYKKSTVMASDAFFPFPDAVKKAAEAGIKSIVQPGGSRNDEKVVKEAEKLGISMVFTGRRHFLH
ncbi:MAG: bifunctional phosphoribosylaminoimidazolecarboxamide formyltransferase/IMP cyclohydrolase [Elusimicrobiota bacterium]